jgi:hypothetical protein
MNRQVAESIGRAGKPDGCEERVANQGLEPDSPSVGFGADDGRGAACASASPRPSAQGPCAREDGGSDAVRAVALFPGAVVSYRLTPEELETHEHRRDFVPPEERVKRADSELVRAWLALLGPTFVDGQSLNFTGTYSDAYGMSHGLMLARNVDRDFRRFLQELGRGSESFALGVEEHRTGRKILHLHAPVSGSWTSADLDAARDLWTAHRGWCVAKLVQDRAGAVRYALKHAMKQGGVECLYWRLPVEGRRSMSKTERRYQRRVARERISPSFSASAGSDVSLSPSPAGVGAGLAAGAAR